MTIIVEDGSIVDNSNSLVSRADYIAYAATLGVTIADGEAADVELIKSAEYIARHESNLSGSRVTRDQSMFYPRYNLYVDGWHWASDEVPDKAIQCQMAYALDINGGEDLYNRSVNPERITTKERVEGAVTVEYADTSGAGQPAIKSSTGDSLLASLLESSVFRASLVRV